MYTAVEIQEKLNRLGIRNHLAADNSYMIQLGDADTTIHIPNNYGYILYTTDADLSGIMKYPWPKEAYKVIDVKDKTEQECYSFLKKEKNKIYCLQNGNRIMNEDAPSYQPHRIYLYSDQIMDAVLEALALTRKEAFYPNMILYGPPGTGKTYYTALYAVAICEGRSIEEIEKWEDNAVRKRYEELKASRRIALTTFHQSYGYEEFIEGIRPVMTGETTDPDSGNASGLDYHVEPGVFKKFCENAGKVEVKTDKFDFNKEAVIWKVTIRPEVMEDCFRNRRIRINWGMDSDGAAGFVNDMKKGDLILATNGSRSVICGIAVVTSDEAYELEDAEQNKTTRNVTWLVTEIDEDIRAINAGKMLHRMTCARVPQMSVADAVELAIRKNKDLAGTQIEKNEKPYVFIIDEINRGNISKIFGELITLIEDTKRQGKPEQASVILPYSKEAFSVPANVYILGTMNTADRSIALMDTALRRRFRFIEKMPQPELLADVTIEQGGSAVNVGEILDTINRRIEFLFDREHTIGHAFFMKLKTNPQLSVLAEIFRQSVIPLLQEYFYEDYRKIQLVLGDNGKEEKYQFIKNTMVLPTELFRGRPFLEKADKYEINDAAFQRIESYIGILNPMPDRDESEK